MFRRMRPPVTAVLLSITLLASLPPARVHAQTPTWRMYGVPGDVLKVPIYDAAHRRMLMISGSDGTDRGFTVWSADLDSAQCWAPIETTGPTPMNPFGEPIPMFLGLSDPRGNRAFIAGGHPLIPGTSGTWMLSLDSFTWERTAMGGSTTYGQGACYDPIANRQLIQCGIDYSMTGNPYPSNGVGQMNLSGVPSWSELTPPIAPDPTPTPRGYVSSVFDPRRNRVLMFGGDYVITGFPATLVPMDELWELSLGASPAWRFIPPSPSPPALASAFTVLDSAQDRLLMWSSGAAPGPNALWVLPLADTDTCRWTHPAATGSLPRTPTLAMLDPVRRTIVMAGGRAAGSGARGGRFELSIDGTPEWSTRVPDLSEPPGGKVAVFDELRGALIAVDGATAWSAAAAQPPRWSPVATAGSVPANGAVVSDPDHDLVVSLFGSYSGPGTNEVWVLPRAGGAWSQVIAMGTLPPSRQNAAAVHDTRAHRVLVYGGLGGVLGTNRPNFDDVWALTLGANPSWTKLDAVGARPPARSQATAVFDSAGNQLVIWGGVDSIGYRSDVRAFSLDSLKWTTLAPTGTAPFWQPGIAATWDPLRRRMLVTSPVGYPSSLTGVWALTLSDGPAWEPLTLQGTGPDRTTAYLTTFDPANDRMLLTRPAPYASQIWALYMRDWVTPVQLSLVEAYSGDGGAHVRWWSADPAATSATLERRVNDGAWQDRGTIARDGSGYFTVSDPDVAPGTRYAYRLAFAGPNRPATSEEATVLVPLAGTVALLAAPNPATGPLRFQATLPAGVTGARLELFDLGGRRLASRTLPNAAGTSRVELTDTRLAPGLYLARILAGSRELAAVRVALLRH